MRPIRDDIVKFQTKYMSVPLFGSVTKIVENIDNPSLTLYRLDTLDGGIRWAFPDECTVV